MAAPPTPPSITTVPHIDSTVETSFHQLLRMYQKTIYAQEAYNKFVGDPNDPAEYHEHAHDIQLATIHKPLINNSSGITNIQQATTALGITTNYLNNRTIFRTIGLLTGIDPEHLGDPFSLNARKNGLFDPEEKGEADDILYNTGVKKVKQSDTKLEYSFVEALSTSRTVAAVGAAGILAGAVIPPIIDQQFGLTTAAVTAAARAVSPKIVTSPYQFIGDTAMLQYLANKAYIFGQPTTPPATTTTLPQPPPHLPQPHCPRSREILIKIWRCYWQLTPKI